MNIIEETELQRAFRITSERFPNCWVSAQESIYGESIRDFRISVIDPTNQCFGETAKTVDESFARVVKSHDRPKTEKINEAIKFLKSQGIETKSEKLEGGEA